MDTDGDGVIDGTGGGVDINGDGVIDGTVPNEPPVSGY